MSSFGLRAPKTLEEALRDLDEWSRHITRFPEQKMQGGITISQQLMRDICLRIRSLEQTMSILAKEMRGGHE